MELMLIALVLAAVAVGLAFLLGRKEAAIERVAESLAVELKAEQAITYARVEAETLRADKSAENKNRLIREVKEYKWPSDSSN